MQLQKLYTAVAAAVVVSFAGVGIATYANASADAIAARKELMKGAGGGAKVVGAMLEGKEPYDAAKAAEALGKIGMAGSEFVAKFDTLFPAGSDQGDTTASPAIWEKPDDFKKSAQSLADDTNAAIAATKTDEAAFKEAAGKMFGNCKTCHEAFRVKKE